MYINSATFSGLINFWVKHMLKLLHYQKQHYIPLKMQIKRVSFHGVLVTFSHLPLLFWLKWNLSSSVPMEIIKGVTVLHYLPWDKLASFCTNNLGKDISMALYNRHRRKICLILQLIKKGKKSVKLQWFIPAKDLASILYFASWLKYKIVCKGMFSMSSIIRENVNCTGLLKLFHCIGLLFSHRTKCT